MESPTHTLDADAALEGEVQEETGARMTFLEHLEELRRRIIYSVYALIACSAVMFYFWDRLGRYMLQYFKALGGQLIYTRLTEGFMFNFKVTLLASLILASPFVFSQLWLFVAPGLYAREKKMALPFVIASTVLFAAGAWFAHVYAFPSMWRFFGSFSGDGLLQFFPTIQEAFSFYVKMVLGFGIVFEMPMLVFVLARFGLVSAKFLLSKFRYAIVLIFIIAAIVTPSPDPFNQCLFAAPMIVLYMLSVLVAWLFGKRERRSLA